MEVEKVSVGIFVIKPIHPKKTQQNPQIKRKAAVKRKANKMIADVLNYEAIPKEVTGYDSFSNNRVFDSLCPVRNVSEDYPPTLLLHGDKDTDVPFEASSQMAAALSLHSVEHQFIILKGLGHMFDRFPGCDDPKVAEAFDVVLAFLRRHIGP